MKEPETLTELTCSACKKNTFDAVWILPAGLNSQYSFRCAKCKHSTILIGDTYPKLEPFKVFFREIDE